MFFVSFKTTIQVKTTVFFKNKVTKNSLNYMNWKAI